MASKRQKSTGSAARRKRSSSGKQDYQDALLRVERILSRNPGSYQAHLEKGKLLFYMGNIDASIAEFLTSAGLRESHEANYCLGNAYRTQQKYNEAVSSYKKSLEIKESIAALTNLGALLSTLGERDSALTYLTRAHGKDPRNTHVLCNLGELLLSVGQDQEALRFANKAYAEDPAFIDTLVLLGKIHHLIGNFDQALLYYGKARKITPHDPTINGMIAELLEIRGDIDQAEKHIMPFVLNQDPTPIIALTYSTILRSRKEYRQAVTYLEGIISRSENDHADNIDLYFELGRVYDKQQQYEKAFFSYAKGNRLTESLYQESLTAAAKNQCLQHASRLCQLDKALWKGSANRSSSPPGMIFIVGMFRTGTSLLEHILSIHPRVHGVGEHNGMFEAAETLVARYNKAQSDPVASISDDFIAQMVSRYRHFIADAPDNVSFLVDKSPVNFRYLGLIRLLFPEARIIHTRRDPIDTCLSIFFQRFRPVSAPYNCNLADIARYYKKYMEIMRYWRDVLDIQILDVNYAELVTDHDQTVRAVLDFCGLEADRQCFEHHRVRRDINTPSYHQVRKPIYSSSLARWKHYEPFIPELIAAFADS